MDQGRGRRYRRLALVLGTSGLLLPVLWWLIASRFNHWGLIDTLQVATIGLVIEFVALIFFLCNARRKTGALTLAGIVIIITCGYVSSFASVSQCEMSTARWLAEDVRPTRPFYVLEKDASPEQRAIWDSVGADYIVYGTPATPGEFNGFPWRSVKSGRPSLPFFVRVEYGWVQEPQVGGGGDIWYFCLFGWRKTIGRNIKWVT